MEGREVDVRAVTDDEAGVESGVLYADDLLAFAEAAVGELEVPLADARDRLLELLGPEALVDAAAVVANFQRMVRIADSTGIPLDAPLALLSEEIRSELGVERFASAANTAPTSKLRSLTGRALVPVTWRVLRGVGAWRRRRRAGEASAP